MTTLTRERPIIFSAPMVRAILAGTKTQTRRVVNPQPPFYGDRAQPSPTVAGAWDFWSTTEKRASLRNLPMDCPYDGRLWVREGWSWDGDGAVIYRAQWTHNESNGLVKWASPIHMRRADSRITLEITDVRVQRLQDISAKDIIAEGVVARSHDVEAFAMVGQNPKCPVGHDDVCYPDLRTLWAATWDRINGKKHPWASNPWVWAITFKRVQP